MLVHPPCARERWDDLEEVRAMIEAGEVDVAVDELRWLVSECGEFLAAHTMLGQIALAENDDVPLARGHFGAAFQLGLTALRRAGMPQPLPYRLPSNQPLFEAGKGLAHCLVTLDKRDLAAEPLEILLACDATDPLGLGEFLRQIRGGETSPRNEN
jgi:hypothetical protein